MEQDDLSSHDSTTMLPWGGPNDRNAHPFCTSGDGAEFWHEAEGEELDNMLLPGNQVLIVLWKKVFSSLPNTWQDNLERRIQEIAALAWTSIGC